nr:ABC transporter permease subunit [Bacteroidota bacterium]
MFFNLLQAELYKIYSKPRSYIGFAALFLISSLIHFALYADGKSYINIVTQSLQQSFAVEGNILNGNLVCYIILQMLIIHVPLLIALVTGDLMSGEGAAGTLRLLVLKPVSRMQIFIAKFIAGSFYTATILIFLAIVAWGFGILFFGKGDLMILRSEEITILPANDISWRFFAAFGAAFIALTVVSAISFMLSCFSNNSVGPIISTMAIIILFTIIATLDLPSFQTIHPYMFTTHLVAWHMFFENPVPYHEILNSMLILLLHIVGCLGIAAWHFTRKDILV